MPLSDIEKRLKEHRKKSMSHLIPGWLRKVLWSGIFIGLAVIIAGVSFIVYYLNQPKGVDLEISAPADVSRGVPFELNVDVTNLSGIPVGNAVINITLPTDLLLWGPGMNGTIYSENVGDLGVGSLYRKTYKVIAVGDLNSSETLNVSVSYVNQSGARFEIKNKASVVISNEALNLSISKPDQVFNGSLFSFSVNYANNSDFDFPNMVLQADFPDSFTFDSSSLPPSSLSNTWQLGSALANSTGTLSVRGEFSGSDSSSFDIPLKLYAVLNGKNYEVADYDASFSLSPSPVGISVFVNGSSNYVAKPIDTLNYSVAYSNMSGIALKDVTVKAVLSGFADWSSVKTDGIFNPASKAVIWNSSTTPALAFVTPGSTGNVTLSLSVNSKAPSSLQDLSNKNLYIKIDASISSPSVPYYVSGGKTFAEASQETRIASLVYLDAKAFFRDTSGLAANAGSFPPKVGVPTDYTVHWVVSNFGNDLSDVKVSAVLPSGVKFTGVSKTNVASSSLAFDPSTGGVVWNIGAVVANGGYLTGSLEGIFQIEATPDASSVGSYETILGMTNLEATDDFTGSKVAISSPPLTTLLPADATVAPGSGVVRQ